MIYNGYSLTEHSDGKVSILAPRDDALEVVRADMAAAIHFVDCWTLSHEDFEAKYGPTKED